MSGVRVLFATSEIAPWVKTGGLGDVAAALPPALVAAGCELRVLVPAYPALVRALGRGDELARFDSPGGALPGCTVRQSQAPGGLKLWLVDAPGFYDREGNPYLDSRAHDWPDNALRFGLLGRVGALLASSASPLDWRAQVLHCNDWQTALAPAYLHYLHGDERAGTVVTIHNLAFQGIFDASLRESLGLPAHAFTIDGVEFHGKVSFLKAGLQFADCITTVSPTYAREILDAEHGGGLDGLLRHRRERVCGILNGIDTATWDPATDPAIARNYDERSLDAKAQSKSALQRELGLEVDPGPMLLGVVSRLTEQKGLDMLLAIADEVCAGGAQIALLGSGDPRLEAGWREAAARNPGRCAAVIGFDESLAHRIEAGADAFAMPSRFEPCGLNQMYSLRYATPPIVRRTGGLADTVVDASPDALADGRANGFVFDEASPQALREALQRAALVFREPAVWRSIQRAGMAVDFGWAGAATRYVETYRRAIALAGAPDSAPD